MNKMTVNLSIDEVQELIIEGVKKEFPNHTAITVLYKMTDAGNERNQPYGHKFTGVDIILERPSLAGRENI